VGGGSGAQSIPLAEAGYEVVIVDPSPAMLEKAASALTHQPAAVSGRVRLIESTGELAAGELGGETFDAVLCHGVLPYVDDPRPLVQSLCSLCRPGGVVSIVAKNRANLAVRPALEGSWVDALAAFDASGEVNRLGFETRADTVDDLVSSLSGHGVDLIVWYGVRLFTDWMESDATTDDFDHLLATELEASRRDPYRQLSRLFHLLGRKG
jgi:SAM-dependent methyltransferase